VSAKLRQILLSKAKSHLKDSVTAKSEYKIKKKKILLSKAIYHLKDSVTAKSE
jgi:hypothetical protein